MVNTNGLYVIIQLQWLQHTLKHNTLLFTCINKKNSTLVIILDLIHLAAWIGLPSFWTHIYYLPTVKNILGVFKFNILEDMVSIRSVWWLGVEMFGIIQFFILSVSQECMSSLFVMLASFWMIFLVIQDIIVLIFVSNRRDRRSC